MDEDALKSKMDEGKYSEVFSELRKYLNANPTDKAAKKLYDKFVNDYKKKEMKDVFTTVDTKVNFQLFDEALQLIEVYIEIIPDDKKAQQLKEKINQQKVRYEIDTGYNYAKEQYDKQNYTEALRVLTNLLKDYPNEVKLIKLREISEKDRWQSKLMKWESEAKEALEGERFDEALKKVEMILKRDSSNKTMLKLKEKILEDEKRIKKKKLWDEINTQVKVQNFSIALKKLKELLEVDPSDVKASKLQSSIIEKQLKFEKKKAIEFANAELKSLKFKEALKPLDEFSATFQADSEIMSLREEILAAEQKFFLDNLIEAARNFIKIKNYPAAEEKIEEALRISNNMSKDAISLKAELDKKAKKDKIEDLFGILALHQKSKNHEAGLDVVNQILEMDPENSKAVKLKKTFEKELGITAPTKEVPKKLAEEEEEGIAPGGAVEVVREYDYIGGEIRFKVAIRNQTETAITNITVLLNITEQYTIESLTKQVPYLAPGETRGVDFMLVPMACGQSNVFGTVSYSDAFGEPHSITVKPKTISIKCPLVVPETASRKEIDDWLKSQLRSSCSVELGNLPRDQAFKIANEQIAAMDLSNVLMDTDKMLAEFLGTAKVTQNKVLVRSTALEDNIKLDVFTDDMKSATGILAYIRNLINIAMNVQSDLQQKEDKIGVQILDAFEIIGRITKLCDLCQILGAVKDGVLILSELSNQLNSSFLKKDLGSEVTHWKDVFEKQPGESCSEEIAANLEYNAINWIKIVHQIAQSKYGVYKDTFGSSVSSAAQQIEGRVNSISDEIKALENAYMRRILKFLMIINKDNGLVLTTHSFGKMEFDSDLVGGFLTAIQSFGLEISQKDTPVTKLEYKDFELVLKDGQFTRVTLVLAGKGTDLIQNKLNTFSSDFEKKFESVLKKWDGNIDHFKNLAPFINKMFSINGSD